MNNSCFFYKFRKLHRTLVNRKIQKIDLFEGQPMVLKYLSTNVKSTQKEIALQVKVKESSISNVLSLMEEMNLITRVKDDVDKRKTYVLLTELGKKKSIECKKINEEIEEIAFKSLKNDERETFIYLFKKVIDNLESEVNNSDKTF